MEGWWHRHKKNKNFFHDVAMAEDTAEGPSDMNETLEKYTKRNELKVNTNETKTAIFRKRG